MHMNFSSDAVFLHTELNVCLWIWEEMSLVNSMIKGKNFDSSAESPDVFLKCRLCSLYYKMPKCWGPDLYQQKEQTILVCSRPGGWREKRVSCWTETPCKHWISSNLSFVGGRNLICAGAKQSGQKQVEYKFFCSGNITVAPLETCLEKIFLFF